MKKSVIKQVFYGFRGTAEHMKMTEVEHKLACIVSDSYGELVMHLTPEQLVLHKSFEDARDLEFIEEADNYYIEGFKLGLLIGIECMEE